MTERMKKSESRLPKEWFARDATIVARELLGKIIRYGECAAEIVETEAYTTDAASHGQTLTERSRVMYETYGHWYVYFTYGMHYCVNVTTNKEGVGAVLIRAAEPIDGLARMQERRGLTEIRKLCSGPAKLCKAFGITKAENGWPVEGSFAIHDAPLVPDSEVVTGPRIGITRDTDLPWRFSIKGSSFVSR